MLTDNFIHLKKKANRQAQRNSTHRYEHLTLVRSWKPYLSCGGRRGAAPWPPHLLKLHSNLSKSLNDDGNEDILKEKNSKKKKNTLMSAGKKIQTKETIFVMRVTLTSHAKKKMSVIK